MTRKIAILGTTPSRMQGPIQDDSGWERWTIGPGGHDVHGWERLYEVHGTWPWDFKDYLNNLSLVKAPQEVWSFSPMPDLIKKWQKLHEKTDEEVAEVIKGDFSSNKIVPREELETQFPRKMWFSSSISWLIAHAIMEGPTDIGLWGIDLESGEEYISQFVGCAHFLDVARILGINVHLPKDTGLLRDITPYPDKFETHLALVLEKKVKYLEALLGQKRSEHESARAEAFRMEGRCITFREQKADEKTMQEAEAALLQANIREQNLRANLNHLEGELSATKYYQRMYVWGFWEPNEFT